MSARIDVRGLGFVPFRWIEIMVAGAVDGWTQDSAIGRTVGDAVEQVGRQAPGIAIGIRDLICICTIECIANARLVIVGILVRIDMVVFVVAEDVFGTPGTRDPWVGELDIRKIAGSANRVGGYKTGAIRDRLEIVIAICELCRKSALSGDRLQSIDFGLLFCVFNSLIFVPRLIVVAVDDAEQVAVGVEFGEGAVFVDQGEVTDG